MSREPVVTQGSIVWALTLYENEAPFRVIAPVSVRGTHTSATALARALGPGRAAEFNMGAKVRPVLLLQDRPVGRLPDLVALKLARVGKLRAVLRDRIVAQGSPLFWFLGHDPVASGLREEAAVDVAALVRIHPTAVVGRPVGHVGGDALAAISERLARALELDLSELVSREAAELLRRHLA